MCERLYLNNHLMWWTTEIKTYQLFGEVWGFAHNVTQWTNKKVTSLVIHTTVINVSLPCRLRAVTMSACLSAHDSNSRNSVHNWTFLKTCFGSPHKKHTTSNHVSNYNMQFSLHLLWEKLFDGSKIPAQHLHSFEPTQMCSLMHNRGWLVAQRQILQ